MRKRTHTPRTWTVSVETHDFVAVAEAAARAHKTPQTLRNWIRLHGIGYRLGSRWVLPAAVVRALETGATPQEARRHITETDARLIAAAPDLLDALREIYHAFLDADGTHNDRQEAASFKACAAIFKATGGIT